MASTVFITGGSGFVGQKAIFELSHKSHRVRALARSDEAARRTTSELRRKANRQAAQGEEV